MNPIPPVIPEFRRPPEAPPVPKDRMPDTQAAPQTKRFEELLSKTKETKQNSDSKTGGTASENRVAQVPTRQSARENHSSLTGGELSGLGVVLSESDASLPTKEIEGETEVGDSIAMSRPAEGRMTADEVLVPSIPGRSTQEEDQGENNGSQGNSDPSLGMMAHNAIHRTFEPLSSDATAPVDAAARISELCRLIGESASTITLDGSGTATIELAQSQLPDAKVIVKIDESSVRVTFLTDNPSSIAVLQARGAEVAGALSLRFDREISVELVDESEADAESGYSRGSWAVERGAFRGQGGEGGGAGSETPS